MGSPLPSQPPPHHKSFLHSSPILSTCFIHPTLGLTHTLSPYPSPCSLILHHPCLPHPPCLNRIFPLLGCEPRGCVASLSPTLPCGQTTRHLLHTAASFNEPTEHHSHKEPRTKLVAVLGVVCLKHRCLRESQYFAGRIAKHSASDLHRPLHPVSTHLTSLFGGKERKRDKTGSLVTPTCLKHQLICRCCGCSTDHDHTGVLSTNATGIHLERFKNPLKVWTQLGFLALTQSEVCTSEKLRSTNTNGDLRVCALLLQAAQCPGNNMSATLNSIRYCSKKMEEPIANKNRFA